MSILSFISNANKIITAAKLLSISRLSLCNLYHAEMFLKNQRLRHSRLDLIGGFTQRENQRCSLHQFTDEGPTRHS